MSRDHSQTTERRARALFVSDLDETLLAPDRSLPARNLEALRAATADGVAFAIVTGRRESKVREVFPLLAGIPFRVAASNGAILLDESLRDSEILQSLPWSMALEIASFSGLERIAVLCITAPGTPNHDVFVLDEHRHWQVSPTPFRRDTWMPVSDAHWQTSSLVHLALLFDDRAAAETISVDLRDWLQRRASVHVVRNPVDRHGALLEIVPHGGKGVALRALARAMGLPTERTGAIGDEANDGDLLDAAGHRYAVAESPLAKQRQDAVTVGSAASGAVADALERFLKQLARDTD